MNQLYSRLHLTVYRTLLMFLSFGLGLSAPLSALANSPLASVCKSDPASIRAMLDDPLLADFFEMTCGASAVNAARQAPTGGARQPAGPFQEPRAIQQPATYPDPNPVNQNRPIPPELPSQAGPIETKPTLDPQLIDQPEPELQPEESTTKAQAVFQKFRFEGQIEIGQDDLARAIAPLMGKPITRERLIYLTQALAKTYRDLGWLVSIHLPNQDVSDGKVTIQIREARFTGLEVVDPQGALRNTTLPQVMVQEAQPIGAPVNLEAIKEAQTRLNELPGVSAQLNLRKGSSERETQGVVQVQPEKPVRVTASVDNSGSRSTGRERVVAGLTVNNPSFRGDQFVAQFLASEGLKYVNLAYSLPVTSRAWRLGLRVSAMNYSLVADEFAGMDAKGPTQSGGVFLQIPWIKTPQARARLDASLTTNRYKHEFNSLTYSRYTSDLLSLGWVASAMNLLPGSNQTGVDVSLTRGRIDLSDSVSDHIASDASGPQTAGYFTKAKLGFSHRQFLTRQTSLSLALRGQLASKNMDGSERFSLGGSGGVRAYPTGEASGSSGGIGSLELQHQIPFSMGSLSLAGFYDYGEISIYKERNFPDSTSPNRYSLKGYGIWLGAEMPTAEGLMGMRFTWVRRQGENPGRTLATGLDQDGTLDKDRFWLDAYYRY